MESWLADTRTSYDTVAAGYTEQLRGALAGLPYMRAMLALFAGLVPDDGPVADVGCGPGLVTADLRALGVNAFGIDLSPAMIDIARREHPGVRFEVGSMTELPLADASVSGLFAWWSLIHVPDEAVPTALAHFHRALRPGGPLMVGFHVGDVTTLKTQGYGGHPMNVHIHRRRPAQVSAFLRDAGFAIESEVVLNPDDPVPGALVFARRPVAAP
ncbi:class I SAM-dependent methyltransferase [Amycolatopsis saalfeldensis]|uniref:Methyltransferase domain-containing protein n=1 Tax=Amycolatopsis saalfeldensis TaxID=394193 RepID=A0A1H8Y7F9_9PSEU|nr:methyltransferase domain-containing protein [Amycolatopsis saalfeldensis]SEP48017.1 Methyltransferase domain-containing protein [Amycolatopsis saalfeldensis]